MPTTLPDMAVRARHQWRRQFTELIPIAVVIFYLLLLAWNAVTLEANLGWLFEAAHTQAQGQDQRQDQNPDRYNPMEPSRGSPNGPNRSGVWPARP